jgi:transposase InsO family protein
MRLRAWSPEAQTKSGRGTSHSSGLWDVECSISNVIIDIFSRYVVGWLVAEHEREELARALIDKTIKRRGVDPGELTLHADRGAAMRSLTVSELLMELGVKRSHSRPRVSNDNPVTGLP